MIFGSHIPSPTFPTPNLLSFQKHCTYFMQDWGEADSVETEMPANIWYKHPTNRDLELSKSM